ncbi:2,3-dihydro-2,3-dihydroxybenzoate dehydrogenase [Prauserella shujinwangii]|uniref:2,3-dihydro-2,3-dihydroxybenzoate dehydrogenase n=1 Tax=Prauserella shujinwangii TaxID=1453103 RepID=A0A2T0LTB7_9PSEU|nr:2,3-dihydro-2,3-dihydroxybenzoate dehydrogenase [Prauserella shujinwangii]PRX46977.1 2,3-dihydro-2,3-dihydroxybenzoate dehydrogenase [Prauserella shujinwangii]
MNSGIEGTVALVTGASGGIGTAVVRAIAERGGDVAAVDVSAGPKSAGPVGAGKVRRYVADVTDSAAVDELVDQVERDLGPIGHLVNAAGVLRTGHVVDLSDADWDVMLSVNAFGVFHVSRAVARRMIPRRGGTIVTVTSNAASVPRIGMTGYAASKAAATQFTRSLGLELAGFGIRCNVIAPGSTDTPMLRSLWSSDSDRAATIDGSPDGYRAGIPLRKVATPRDIANAVVFLLSDEAGHITLESLCVDGGAALGAV